MSSLPPQCGECTKTEAEADICRIRQVQFAVFGRKCPREEPEKPKAIVEDVVGDRYLELPLELIYWKDPVRKDIRKEDVDAMATSFACHGQIEPIVVSGPDEEGKYEGVCGRLRYEAMKRFQGRSILARVHKFGSAREKREWQLAENLHRRDLTAVQKADAFNELYESYKEELGGVHHKHIVSTMAKSLQEISGEKAPAERTLQQYIQVSKELPEKVKKTVTGHAFGVRHALQLLRLKEKPEEQLKLAESYSHSDAVGKPWTVQQMKKRVDETISPPGPKPSPIDTGMKITCPICNQDFMLIHSEKHRLDPIKVI